MTGVVDGKDGRNQVGTRPTLRAWTCLAFQGAISGMTAFQPGFSCPELARPPWRFYLRLTRAAQDHP